MPQKKFYCLCSPVEEFWFMEIVSWSLFSFCQFRRTPMFSSSTCQLLIFNWISWASRSYTVLGRKEDKSWDTKTCLKSSNLSYSLGKIQGWVLVNAEALGMCFQTSSRLQAWVNPPFLHFPYLVRSEMYNSTLRQTDFFLYIFNSISQWTLSLKLKIFTVHFYFT